jgi:small subunit ribosomal protein S16
LVKIRLKRMGSTKQPFYRIVAADARKTQGGSFLDSIGHYDPLKKPMELRVDESKFFEWMSKGAQVTDTVKSLLRRSGTWDKWTRLSAGEKGIDPEVVTLTGEKRTTGD